jgi:hypothetical protein
LLVDVYLKFTQKENAVKTIIVTALVVLFAVSGAEAGDKKYNSKGAGQSKRPSQTVLEQQTYMHWLQQGCPPLVAPRPQPQQQPQPQPKAIKK